MIDKLGHSPGTQKRWCAACGKDFTGGAASFKCEPCAKFQAKEVDRLSRAYGLEWDE